MIQFMPSWVGLLTLVVSVVLPVLVGLVTQVKTNPTLKAVLLVVLAAVTGFLSELLNALVTGSVYDIFTGLITFITALIIGIALHFGFWKPTGVTDAVQRVGS